MNISLNLILGVFLECGLHMSAHIELQGEGLTMGLEPVWEQSTLGGWVASRNRSHKQARYGVLAARNAEFMT